MPPAQLGVASADGLHGSADRLVGDPRSPLGGGGAAAAFVIGAFAASASWPLVLVGGGGALGRALTSRTGRLVTGLLSSVVILALTIALLIR